MSDFIDQIFDKAGQSNADGFVDASREELLQQLTPVEEQSTLTQKASAPQAIDPGRIAGNNVAQRGGMDMIQGAVKWVDEHIGIPVEDLVDNVFQGNQRTPDQIAKDRAASLEVVAKQMAEQKTIDDLPGLLKTPAKGIRELGGVIAGGMTGAAETVLNTGEILGDTVKTFASLGRVKEDQNPFSTKYEWANWDLGRSEAGAQSGVGQIAQGFLEFGMIMAATGGFGGMAGAGAKFAQAGTALGKAGVLARAGAQGAASGFIADMMSATRGEGNLSNLIKKHAPDWYPTWLTALAVDEDDTPYEAMLKTALEGSGLGAAADALMAYIGGVRAARRAAAEGLSEAEQAFRATETAQDILDNQNISVNASTQPTPVALDPESYVAKLDATKASDPSTYWSVDSVDLDSASKGKIITVEGGAGVVSPDGDIKGVFKDPASTQKGVADQILSEAVAQGGIKLDNFDGYLSKIYEKNGFREVSRVPFNADYAPPGWDEALHGKPDVVAMIYDPQGRLNITPQRFDDYDEAIAYRDRLVADARLAYPTQVEALKADTEFLGKLADFHAGVTNWNRVEYQELAQRLRGLRDSDLLEMGRALGWSTYEARAMRGFISINTQINNMGGAVKYTYLPDGGVIHWSFTKDPDATSMLGTNERALQVSWDIEDGSDIGTQGRYVVSDFNRMVREEIEPGTVMVNHPAGDDYARRGASEAQSRRAARARMGSDIPNDLVAEYYAKDQAPAFLRDNPEYSPEEAAELLKREYMDMGARSRAAMYEGYFENNPEFRDAAMEWAHAQQAAAVDSRSIRERLYQRVGFGPADVDTGVQIGVTRNAPDGRGRWLSPFEAEWDGDMLINQSQVHALIETNKGRMGRAYENLAYPTDSTGIDVYDRQARLNDLMAQSRRGIATTWDDSAAVVPEYFTPGTRPQADAFSPDVMARLGDANSGDFVVNPFTGEEINAAYAVAIDGKVLRGSDPDSITDFIVSNREILSRYDAFLARMTNEETGEAVTQLVRVNFFRNEALGLGSLFDQPFVRNLTTGEDLATYGDDILKDTRGNHMASHFGTPMESPTVDPTTAVHQQMQGRQNPLQGSGGSQPTITQRQLTRIARAIGDEPGDLLRRMVRENPVNLDELSSVSRQTPEEVAAEAMKGIQEALGATGEVDFTKILNQNVGEDVLLTRAGIVQVRGLMQELSTRLYESGYQIMQMGQADMDAFPQVARMAEELKALMRIHKESANAYSRYLSTYKIKVPVLGIEIPNPIKPPSVEELAAQIKDGDKVLDDLVKKLASGDPKARSEAMRIANALVFAEGDPAQLPSIWKYIRKIAAGDGLSVMYNSMLSGPKTHLVNTLSNAVNTVYRPLAAATGGDMAVKRAAAASFHSFQQTLGESFHMAFKAMKDGPLNDGSKTMLAAAEATERLKLLQRSATLSDDLGFKAAVGFLDTLHKTAEFPLFSWPSKLLTGSDEFFKTMVSRMEYNSRTMLTAIQESAGSGSPTKEVFERLLKQNLDEAFDTATGAIKDETLLSAAKDVTFQTDLEGWAKSFSTFVNEVPVLRVFFPFVKTGHNVMVYAGTHVPILNTFLSEYKAVMAGSDEYAKAVMRGREAYGRLLVMAGGTAALNGILTGNGPPDPQERKLWEANNQPRSINLTRLTNGAIKGEGGKDKFLDYSRIEPFGQILSGVADVVDMFSSGRLSEDRAQYLIGYLTYAIAANFTNKSYMQGTVPLGQILTPGWQGLSTLTTLPLETLNNFIPLSGSRRTLANMLTPYKQEFNSQLDRLLYQASGSLVKTGSTMYDHVTGEPVPAISGGPNALMPLAVGDRGGNAVKDALEDIEFDNSFLIKSISGIKLDRQHRSRLQQLMGSGAMEKDLEKWVTHKNFKPAVEEFLQKLRSGERVHKENAVFYNEIVRIMTRHRDLAVQQLKTEFPELQAQILDDKLIRTQQRRAGTQTQVIDFEHPINLPIK